jgi:hypothetical protein
MIWYDNTCHLHWTSQLFNHKPATFLLLDFIFHSCFFFHNWLHYGKSFGTQCHPTYLNTCFKHKTLGHYYLLLFGCRFILKQFLPCFYWQSPARIWLFSGPISFFYRRFAQWPNDRMLKFFWFLKTILTSSAILSTSFNSFCDSGDQTWWRPNMAVIICLNRYVYFCIHTPSPVGLDVNIIWYSSRFIFPWLIFWFLSCVNSRVREKLWIRQKNSISIPPKKKPPIGFFFIHASHM